MMQEAAAAEAAEAASKLEIALLNEQMQESTVLMAQHHVDKVKLVEASHGQAVAQLKCKLQSVYVAEEAATQAHAAFVATQSTKRWQC